MPELGGLFVQPRVREPHLRKGRQHAPERRQRRQRRLDGRWGRQGWLGWHWRRQGRNRNATGGTTVAPVLGGEGESCTKRADCEADLRCFNQRCTASGETGGGAGAGGQGTTAPPLRRGSVRSARRACSRRTATRASPACRARTPAKRVSACAASRTPVSRRRASPASASARAQPTAVSYRSRCSPRSAWLLAPISRPRSAASTAPRIRAATRRTASRKRLTASATKPGPVPRASAFTSRIAATMASPRRAARRTPAPVGCCRAPAPTRSAKRRPCPIANR